ncbi:hypothetical protein D9M68_643710 [compost metagenome]
MRNTKFGTDLSPGQYRHPRIQRHIYLASKSIILLIKRAHGRIARLWILVDFRDNVESNDIRQTITIYIRQHTRGNALVRPRCNSKTNRRLIRLRCPALTRPHRITYKSAGRRMSNVYTTRVEANNIGPSISIHIDNATRKLLVTGPSSSPGETG